MFKILLGTWALAGLLTSGLLTAVAQNPPSGSEDGDATRQSQESAPADRRATDEDEGPRREGDTTQREQQARQAESARNQDAPGQAVEPSASHRNDRGASERSDDQPPQDAQRNQQQLVTGATGEGRPNDLGVQFRMNSSGRLSVSSVDQQEIAGLREGDVIVSAGGRTFETEPALREFLTREARRDQVPLVVMRDGRELTVTWSREPDRELAAPAAPVAENRENAAGPASIGAIVVDTRFGLHIADVVAGSPAEVAGLQPGDFILGMNGQRYLSSARFTADIARLPVSESVELQISRDGQTIGIEVQPQAREIVYGRSRQRGDAVVGTEQRSRRMGRMQPGQERIAARPDFDTSQRVQELEARVDSLQRDLEQLRHRLSAVLGNEPGHDAESAPSDEESTKESEGADAEKHEHANP